MGFVVSMGFGLGGGDFSLTTGGGLDGRVMMGLVMMVGLGLGGSGSGSYLAQTRLK